MKSRKLIALSAALFSAGCLALSGCGDVPSGLTEQTALPTLTAAPTETAGEGQTPAPNMDLTPNSANGSGMAEAQNGETVRVTLHYITDEGFVLPVQERIEKQEGIARACLMKLIGSDENENFLKSRGLNAPLPKGTQFGLSIQDGEARVMFYGIEPPSSEEEAADVYASIVNTLLQFASVQRVSVYFSGSSEDENTPTPPRGMESCALNVENEALETAAGGGASALTLYFPNTSASLFVPVTRYVSPLNAGLCGAIAQLAKGTQLDGLRGCFPENTLILGAAIENGVLSVNCSSDFLGVNESPSLYSLAMQSVLLTARPFGSIDEIVFLVNGVPFEPNE